MRRLLFASLQNATNLVHDQSSPVGVQLILGIATAEVDREGRDAHRDTWFRHSWVASRAVVPVFLCYKHSSCEENGGDVMHFHRSPAKTLRWYRRALAAFPRATHIGKMDLDTFPVVHRIIGELLDSQSKFVYYGRPVPPTMCRGAADAVNTSELCPQATCGVQPPGSVLSGQKVAAATRRGCFACKAARLELARRTRIGLLPPSGSGDGRMTSTPTAADMQGGLYVLSRSLAEALSGNESRFLDGSRLAASPLAASHPRWPLLANQSYVFEDAAIGWMLFDLEGRSGRLTLISGRGCEHGTHDYHRLRYKYASELKALCAPDVDGLATASPASSWFHPLKRR